MTWLTPAQAATHLGVPRRRIYQAIHTRQLVATDLGRPTRAYWRIRDTDLDAWTRSRQTVDTAPARVAH